MPTLGVHAVRYYHALLYPFRHPIRRYLRVISGSRYESLYSQDKTSSFLYFVWPLFRAWWLLLGGYSYSVFRLRATPLLNYSSPQFTSIPDIPLLPLSVGFLRSVTLTVRIHHTEFRSDCHSTGHIEHDVSKTGFCLCLAGGSYSVELSR
jgi:hypothetical protein